MRWINDSERSFYAVNTPRATNTHRYGWRLITAVICILITAVWMTACESVDVDSPPKTAPPIVDTESQSTETEPPAAEAATPVVAPTTAELPRLDIYTEGKQSIDSKEEYTRSTVTLSNCDREYTFTNIPAGIRLRGNLTTTAPKKPYRLKFDKKQSILGLTNNCEFRSWCLLADYYDPSMLRTFGTFKLAKALLKNEYFSADCTHVDVYLNGEYQGVYLLCDQTQINKGRVDIPEKKDGDTSLEHGYLLIGQGNRTDEPDSIVIDPNITVTDRNGNTAVFRNLNFALSGSGYTEMQKSYVKRYCEGVFQVVSKAVYDHEYYELSRNGRLTPKRSFEWAKTDEEKQIETVSAVFNIESAVSMCILDEIVKNLDAMTFNMYVDLSTSGDGVLTLAAPWDFDFSMANTIYHNTPTGFYATNLSLADTDRARTNLWYVMLGSIDWFEEMCREKWQETYGELKAVVAEMEYMSIAYDEAFNRDYEKWGLPIDRKLISHNRNDLKNFTDHSISSEFVTNWLENRLLWLNTKWGNGEDGQPPREPAAPS